MGVVGYDMLWQCYKLSPPPLSFLPPPSLFSLVPKKMHLPDYPIYGRILNSSVET